MKAWVVHEFQEKENLTLQNVVLNDVGKNQVLIDIKASGINNKDIYIRKGIYFRQLELPLILGSDIAGVISKVGQDVKKFKVDDRVLVSPIKGCNTCTYCMHGEENNCSKYESILRGFAEQLIIEENQLLPIPDSLSFEEAASLPISYLTAWNMLFNKAKIKQTETVLIWGASSGVGTAGIVLFNNPDNVIAVAGSDQKVEALKQRGVHKVIDYKKDHILDEVMRYTSGEGVDVIFDPVGKAAWNENLTMLKHNGRHVNCARNTGRDAQIDLSLLFGKQLALYGAKSGSKKDLQDILHHLVQHRLSPIIDRVFKFEKAENALQYMELGKHFGKIVLTNTND